MSVAAHPGDRHVPPRLEAGHPLLGLGRHHDDRDPVRGFRLRERIAKLVRRARVERQCAHRLGVRPEVDRDVRAVQPVAGGVAEAQLVAEVRHADEALEGQDALEAVVVEDDDRQLQALGDRGHDLRVHHQVRAVTDHHDDVAIGIGQAHPEPGHDLVAHAREAVLDVVGLGILGAPQPQQVAGQAARRADDRRVAADRVVDDPDHLGLAKIARLIVGRPEPVDDPVPLRLELRDALAVGRRRPA